MEEPPPNEVTGLLQAWSAGNEQALEKLVPLVYRQLHRAARRYMAGERSGHALQATALIMKCMCGWLIFVQSTGKTALISLPYVPS